MITPTAISSDLITNDEGILKNKSIHFAIEFKSLQKRKFSRCQIVLGKNHPQGLAVYEYLAFRYKCLIQILTS